MKVDELGFYIYSPDFHLAPSHPQDQTYKYALHIINTNTKEIINLFIKKMKNILADVPELLKKYEKDKSCKYNYQKYISEYNRRYTLKTI